MVLAVTAVGRVTMREVAARAEVSLTTVSHVLSGRGRVSPGTRLRVQAVVRELGFRANPLARNLRQARFGAIGLYLPERSLGLPFYVDMAVAASRAVFDAGCGLTLLPPVDDPAEVLGLPLDGVIVAEPVLDDPVANALAAANVPLVFCEAAAAPRPPGTTVIDMENGRAISQLLDHLVEQGARDLVVVGAHDGVWWARLNRTATERWSRSRRHPVEWVSMPFACGPEQARETVDKLLDERVPDALVIGQQGLAGAALAAATARGLSVPDDLLLACGVDGPDLPALRPSVTALDLRPSDCGRLAAEILLGRREGTRLRLRPRLVVRDSSVR
jgi:DNA-binding LacI/PurR family transcriptional regulator